MSKKRQAPTWTDLENELVREGALTREEIAKNNARAMIMIELIRARNEQQISQRQLEALSGVQQATIARIENNVNSPSINTMLKVLAPLGKTLAVVPIEYER
jgi:DNA-binding XRE family transcriptional regulator